MDETVLGHYQRRLLEMLRAGEEPAAIRAALLADERLVSLRSYVEGLEPHVLVVAAELVARWGADEP